MLEKLKKALHKETQLPDELTYEEARDYLAREEPEIKAALAKREDVRPEILYYLARDESPEIRRSIAANPSTPVKADALLVGDSDDEVRCELARKISRLLPDLDPGTRTRLREEMIALLERLAADQLPRVRQIIAEEIKQARNVPHHLVKQLAQDVELVVCAPILEYSPLLNDDDLREIIAGTTVSGALEAISRRAQVSEDVSDAIASTLDVPAVAALLANPSAQIREETLDRIIDQAEEIEAWHQPMVMRPELSIRAMRRIAGFVASSLVNVMIERHGIEDDFADELLKKVRERIASEPVAEPDPDHADPRKEIAELFDAGALDDTALGEALDQKRRRFVILALARLARIEAELVTTILDTKNGVVITALTWKAGLAMRTALRLQRELARVPPDKLVNARNGVDYPFTPEEMAESLSPFLS